VNDLKNRISETAKYIRPNENTMDFAFMFIPHEAIYYDLLTNKVGALREESENLIQRAASKYKVIIVSPTSFLAYLTDRSTRTKSDADRGNSKRYYQTSR
jgi:DNA recombination protein RmuC